METFNGGETPSNEPEKKRLMTAIYGKEGVGKTTLALTFPPPFFIINADRNMSKYLKLLPKTHKISYERLVLDDVDALSPEMAKVYLAKINKMIREALAAGHGTLIWEGEDIIWDVVKTAMLPRGDAKAREYADANNWMENHYQRVEASELNMAITSFAKPEWVGETRTSGKFVREGWKWTPRWYNTAVYLYLGENTKPDETPTPRTQTLDLKFTAQVTENKEDKRLTMRTLPRLTYALLYKMTFHEMPPSADLLWKPNYGEEA